VRALRSLIGQPGPLLGLVILLALSLGALTAPWLAPYDPLAASEAGALAPPSAQHLFGTDDAQRDVLSRVLYGGQISLRVGLIAVGIAATTGSVLGLAAGYFGGWLDGLIMRLMDVLLAFPGILLALVVVTVLGPGLSNVMIAVGVGGVPTYTRVARAAALTTRSREYVLGARTVGCGHARILWAYILPNALAPLIVLATLGVATAILTASGLSFLGLGAQPPTPEWGAMLTNGRTYLRQAWWPAVFPGMAILLSVLSINLLGDGLRDALDPRLSRSSTRPRD
jgi:peptide/nickel transport system permease protein